MYPVSPSLGLPGKADPPLNTCSLLLMEATARLVGTDCKAANAGHGNEVFRLDGEQDREKLLQLSCAAGWYN